MIEKEKAQAKAEEVELTEIVTQTSQAFKLPDGKVVDVNELLVWMSNQIIELRKAIG